MSDGFRSADAIADAYAAAWTTRDVEQILAFHTEDTTFEAPALGQRAHGRDAVGAAFSLLFSLWPDLRFDIQRRYVSARLIVFESFATCTLAAPFELAGHALQPNGRPISFPVADILPLKAGRVASKLSYFDALGYVTAMSAR